MLHRHLSVLIKESKNSVRINAKMHLKRPFVNNSVVFTELSQLDILVALRALATLRQIVLFFLDIPMM